MDWNDGYVSGIDYPFTFNAQQGPTHLNFACVLNGMEPLPPERPFTYCELGAGQGFTTNILAAANPHGTFYAADFMPGHVVAARELAAQARLENVHFIECSFEQMAAGEVDLPQLDYITMFGVYSWVNQENRDHIVRFISRYLKPGGIVYLNYNSMPGWTATLPLQRLMMEHARCHPGPRDVQIDAARAFFESLVKADGLYFKNGGALKARMEVLADHGAGYLAHEYMNEGWQPLYHMDVARSLVPAKLDYIGTASLWDAMPNTLFTAGQQTLLAGFEEADVRNTVEDFICTNGFREDIYVRGARRMTPQRQRECLARLGLALTVVRSNASCEFVSPGKDLKGSREKFVPLFDALEKRPHSLLELAALPALEGEGLLGVARMAGLLMKSRQASVYALSAGEVDAAPSLRLNRVIAGLSQQDDRRQALASPLLGAGIHSGLVQRLMYHCLEEFPERDSAEELTAQVADILAGQQSRTAGDKVKAPAPTSFEELLPIVGAIMEQRFPVWKQLLIR